MHAEFHPEADQEFIEQALFYELAEPGLGYRFIDEIERGIDILLSQPGIGTILDTDLQYFVLDNFPFSLIYGIEQEKLWVVAVAHQSRRPGYWRERMSHRT